MSVKIGGVSRGQAFEAILENLDKEPALFKVKAELYFNGSWYPFPQGEHYYGGDVEWNLPGEGMFGGDIGIEGVLKSMNIALLGSGAWLKLTVVGQESAYWRFDAERVVWLAEPSHQKAPG